MTAGTGTWRRIGWSAVIVLTAAGVLQWWLGSPPLALLAASYVAVLGLLTGPLPVRVAVSAALLVQQAVLLVLVLAVPLVLGGPLRPGVALAVLLAPCLAVVPDMLRHRRTDADEPVRVPWQLAACACVGGAVMVVTVLLAGRPDSFGLATWSASGDARLHLLFARMVLEEGGLHGTPFSFQPEYQEALTALFLDTHGRGTLAPGALLEHDLRGVARVSVALTVLWTVTGTATLLGFAPLRARGRGRGRGRGLAAAADRAGAGRGAPRRLPADPAAGAVDPLQPDGARLAEHDRPHRRRGHRGRRRLRGRDPAAGVHVDAARRGGRGRRPAAVAARAAGRRPPRTTGADDGSRHRRRGGVLPVRAVPGGRLRRHPRGDRVAHAGDGAAGAGARPADRDRTLVGDRGRRVRALPGRDRRGGRDHGVRRAGPGGGSALELLPGEDRLDLDARRAPAPPGALRAPTGRVPGDEPPPSRGPSVSSSAPSPCHP